MVENKKDHQSSPPRIGVNIERIFMKESLLASPGKHFYRPHLQKTATIPPLDHNCESNSSSLAKSWDDDRKVTPAMSTESSRFEIITTTSSGNFEIDRGNYREPIKVQGKEANMETGDMTCVESLHQTSIVKNLKSLFESKTQHPDAREKSPMKTPAFKKPLYPKRPPTDLPISHRETVVDSKEALVSSRNSIRAVRNFWKEKEHNQPQVSTEDHFDFGRRKLSTESTPKKVITSSLNPELKLALRAEDLQDKAGDSARETREEHLFSARLVTPRCLVHADEETLSEKFQFQFELREEPKMRRSECRLKLERRKPVHCQVEKVGLTMMNVDDHLCLEQIFDQVESLSDSTSGTDIKLDLVVQEDTLVHAMCNHQLRATQPAWWARQHVQEVQNDGDSCETIELKPASLDISLVEINGDFSSFSDDSQMLSAIQEISENTTDVSFTTDSLHILLATKSSIATVEDAPTFFLADFKDYNSTQTLSATHITVVPNQIRDLPQLSIHYFVEETQNGSSYIKSPINLSATCSGKSTHSEQQSELIQQQVKMIQECNDDECLIDLGLDFSSHETSPSSQDLQQHSELKEEHSCIIYLVSLHEYIDSSFEQTLSLAIYNLDCSLTVTRPLVNDMLLIMPYNDAIEICDMTIQPCTSYQKATESKTSTPQFELSAKEIWVPQSQFVQTGFDHILLNSNSSNFSTFLMQILEQSTPAFAPMTCNGIIQLELTGFLQSAENQQCQLSQVTIDSNSAHLLAQQPEEYTKCLEPYSEDSYELVWYNSQLRWRKEFYVLHVQTMKDPKAEVVKNFKLKPAEMVTSTKMDAFCSCLMGRNSRNSNRNSRCSGSLGTPLKHNIIAIFNN